MVKTVHSILHNRKKQDTSKERSQRNLYFFILPGIIGFLAFQAIPILYSFILSLFKYDGFTAPVFNGIHNFTKIFTDLSYWQALYNTIYMVLLGVPVNLFVALILAFALNRENRAMGAFRTVYYIPTLLPQVATAVLMLRLFNLKFGLLNLFLSKFGLPAVDWLGDPNMAKNTLILLGVWGVGKTIIVYLARLQGIPKHYYEAAEIDGAPWSTVFIRITIPMLTPAILYNMVIEAVFAFQIFTPSFVITNGGPQGSTRFYVFKIWEDAFKYSKFGLASAQAVVLFFIVLGFTLLAMKTSEKWVYYEGDAS